MTTKTQHFDGLVGTVHQTGDVLSSTSGFSIHLHFRDREQIPCIAELISDDQSEYAEIGLEFDCTTLTGYDGVFEIPSQLIDMLKEAGFLIGEGIE